VSGASTFGQTVVLPSSASASASASGFSNPGTSSPLAATCVASPEASPMAELPPGNPNVGTGVSSTTGAETAAASSRYQAVRQIGEGGMGEVLLSRDPTIGRQVAVKRMKRQPIESPGAADRFMTEVQTTGKLEHPGIVPIYDAGFDAEGNPYFVMKYVNGEPLNQIIARLREGNPEYVQRFSYEHRAQIFMQLLRAVQYAHHQGVLHLDIKPANVLVGPFGEVVLVDWGIAQTRETPAPALLGSSSGKPMAAVAFTGTPDYMSPEQALGKMSAIGPHTDTYCLSVLFYELITLHYYLPPKQTLEGRITSILIDEPLTGLQMHHRFGAPPELTNYIHYGLNKDAEKRFRTVEEMVSRLQDVMDGLIPVVCPCTGIKRAANSYGDFMNAHPILAVVGVCLVALFTMFGLFELVRLLAFRTA
jgi:serine/threonine protein kinase